MSLYDFHRSQALERADEPFEALIMAAMRRADSENLERLRAAFPEIHAEVTARYNLPQGLLPGETNPATGDSLIPAGGEWRLVDSEGNLLREGP